LFELVPEDEEMFEFVQDDMELFNQLDFIREDFSWKSSDKTQQKLKPWEAICSTGVVSFHPLLLLLLLLLWW